MSVGVSVILVNYNTCELTKACIDSIFDKTEGVDFEVILVDNNSKDFSRETFLKDSRIQYHYLDQNLGFGKANNYGAERSSGKYLFFLNSDTLLRNNAIKIFYDFCENYAGDDLGAVGCMLEDAEGRVVHSYGSFPKMRSVFASRITSPVKKLLGIKKKKIGVDRLDDTCFRVDYVTGADLFVSRDIIDKFGGFDPDFFMYYEETEMQRRYAKQGHPSRIICAPRIAHLEGGSFKKKAPQGKPATKITNRLRFNQESQFLYMQKTHSRLSCSLFRVMFYIIRLPFMATLNKADRRLYHQILTK